MTSTDLVRPGASLDAQKEFAVTIAASDLLPKHYQQKPANVLVAMQWADALGMNPMTAMQQLYILDGKPTASAQLIASLVRRAGHQLRVQGDSARAVCEIVRSDDPDFVFRATWTLERAKNAGLTSKQVWKSYPEAMLKARAITEAARDACPEALLGVDSTAEELDVPVAVSASARVAPPAPAPAPAPKPPAVPVDLLPPGVVMDADGVLVDVTDAEVIEGSEDLP